MKNRTSGAAKNSRPVQHKQARKSTGGSPKEIDIPDHPFERIITHCLVTLPSSGECRASLLRALRAWVTTDHPQSAYIDGQLAALPTVLDRPTEFYDTDELGGFGCQLFDYAHTLENAAMECAAIFHWMSNELERQRMLADKGITGVPPSEEATTGFLSLSHHVLASLQPAIKSVVNIALWLKAHGGAR